MEVASFSISVIADKESPFYLHLIYPGNLSFSGHGCYGCNESSSLSAAAIAVFLIKLRTVSPLFLILGAVKKGV
jgi:hypothetical protein